MTTTTDDREALKARFSAFHAPVATPPPEPSKEIAAPIADTLHEKAPLMQPGQDRIKLKIRRSQNKALMRGVGFSVHFIAELSPDARKAVDHYGFGKVVLFEKDLKLKMTANPIKIIWRFIKLALTRSQWQITVNDLVQGRTISCKDILEMLDVEEDIRQAAKLFADVLRTASTFGGEELIDL